MTRQQLEKYRVRLLAAARAAESTARSLRDQALVPGGGQAAGELSNAPLHLGDAGTEAFHQELNSALLENEGRVRAETADALERIDRGTFGICEACGRPIPAARLDALPYARHCVACAAGEGAGVNLDEGRAQQGRIDPLRDRPEAGGRSANTAAYADLEDLANARDRHAAGTPGGGAAAGGLAGTNLADGSPAGTDLEGAMGGARPEAEGEAEGGYSGPSGGAVGGTPAGKRATGGRARS